MCPPRSAGALPLRTYRFRQIAFNTLIIAKVIKNITLFCIIIR